MQENQKLKNKETEIEVAYDKVADETKREFMKKYGKFAATAPAMGFLLMTLGTSKAHAGSALNQDGGAP